MLSNFRITKIKKCTKRKHENSVHANSFFVTPCTTYRTRTRCSQHQKGQLWGASTAEACNTHPTCTRPMRQLATGQLRCSNASLSLAANCPNSWSQTSAVAQFKSNAPDSRLTLSPAAFPASLSISATTTRVTTRSAVGCSQPHRVTLIIQNRSYRN